LRPRRNPELQRQIEDVMAGELLQPSVATLPSLASSATMNGRRRRCRHRAGSRIFHRRGANTTLAHAVVDVTLDQVEIPQTASQLHRLSHRRRH